MSIAILKKLLAPRQMEYLVMDANFHMVDFSIGVLRFAESTYLAALFQSDIQLSFPDVRLGFPELVGLESTLHALLFQDLPHFQLKGIARRDIYFDLLIIATLEENTRDRLLALIFEDVTEKMLLTQTLAQRTNETLLLMEALSSSKEYLHKILDMMADVLIVTSPSGKIKTINQAVQRLFGYEKEFLIGQPITFLFPEFDLLLQKNQEVEVTGCTQDGHSLSIAFSCARIPIGEQHYEWVFSGRDITQRKEAEAQLETARVLAIAASQSKSLFLANMSHEIRTPMNAVVGMTELLLTTPLNSEQSEFVENIRLGADALLALINDILDISKLEAGELFLESGPFNISNTLEEVVTMLANQAHSKGLEIIAWIDRRLCYPLRGDKNRIKQVVTNLVSNAIKFTSKGEVTVRLELEAQSDHETTFLCSITDTGIGIPIEQKELLFAPFIQGDVTTTRRYGGTGLGLAICKQLITLMGGEINFDSWAGKGTSFWFRVRLPHDRSVNTYRSVNSLAGKCILLIEHNPKSCAAFIEQLESLGMVCVAVTTIDQVRDYLSGSTADGILIDKVLFDGMQEIRTLPGCATIPIVLLIKSHEIHSARQAITLGVDDFLIKPVTRQRLMVLLSTLFGDPLLTPSSPPPPVIDRKSLRILLAEDNLANQLVTIKLLKRLGYAADVANNGQEVLEHLAEKEYDIIFMDCQMPIVDGYETTRRIREQEKEAKHTTIVAMTASAMKEDKERCLAVGMDGYLSKPVSLKKLQEVLDTIHSEIVETENIKETLSED